MENPVTQQWCESHQGKEESGFIGGCELTPADHTQLAQVEETMAASARDMKLIKSNKVVVLLLEGNDSRK